VADKVGTSIGIALYPQDGTQGAELVRKADAAMYAAKQGGKNAWRFSTTELVIQG
jgi:GGDEF domain-containing protein